MTIQAPYYPIIYVRGYAATMAEMEATVATPYMGFNLGSTKLRQDHENSIRRFIFESPLIRLKKDEGYEDAYENGDFIETEAPARSIWIFRYYEQSTESLGEGRKEEIEGYARDLGAFVLRVREAVCGDDAAALAKFKVYLVAHSMGGLIARCYIQSIRDGQNHHVDKVFTYGTPHNGIEIKGANVPNLGSLDSLHVSNFNRTRMREYLAIQTPGDQANTLDGKFPAERFFCFIGTNHRDYGAFFGLSKHGTGPMSDGLVMMKNAYVEGAPRAYAYRSHSGDYGIVNSEEGYQNLRRFLFGQVRVDARLAVDELTLPRAVHKEKDKGRSIRASYDIDVDAKVRSAGVYLTERKASQESAIRKSYQYLMEEKRPAYLFSGYLHKAAKKDGKEGGKSNDTALAFAVRIAINVPAFEVDRRFRFDDYFEGEMILQETITFHVRTSAGKTTVKFGLSSEVGPGHVNRTAQLSEPDAQGHQYTEIPLGFKAGMAENKKPRPGFRGRLLLTASPWNAEAT